MISQKDYDALIPEWPNIAVASLPTYWGGRGPKNQGVLIRDMEDKHLLNSVRLMIRAAATYRVIHMLRCRRNSSPSFCKPTKKNARPLMHEWKWLRETATWKDFVDPVTIALIVEARRRGLSEASQRDTEKYGSVQDKYTKKMETAVLFILPVDYTGLT